MGLFSGTRPDNLGVRDARLAPPKRTPNNVNSQIDRNADPVHYNPTNITFGIMPPLDQPPRSKNDRQLAISARALADLAGWLHATGNGVG